MEHVWVRNGRQLQKVAANSELDAAKGRVRDTSNLANVGIKPVQKLGGDHSDLDEHAKEVKQLLAYVRNVVLQ